MFSSTRLQDPAFCPPPPHLMQSELHLVPDPRSLPLFVLLGEGHTMLYLRDKCSFHKHLRSSYNTLYTVLVGEF